jgi:hypothetical protein
MVVDYSAMSSADFGSLIAVYWSPVCQFLAGNLPPNVFSVGLQVSGKATLEEAMNADEGRAD